MNKKELYAAPTTEVLELHLEGNVLQVVSGEVNTQSPDGGVENFDWGWGE